MTLQFRWIVAWLGCRHSSVL